VCDPCGTTETAYTACLNSVGIYPPAAYIRAAVFVVMSSLSIYVMAAVGVLNMAAVIVLSAYALHQAVLLLLYVRIKSRARHILPKHNLPEVIGANRDAQQQPLQGSEQPPGGFLPIVTVQLPLYNERYVAERIIAAACALDYPRELLEIQVLDDSTDDTRRIVASAVNAAREHGLNIVLIQRTGREGYKAGALANGLRTARGELIAIFDADFIPPRHFLRRVVCESGGLDDPRVAFIQTRWGHMNSEANAVTLAQTTMLDMHFIIDQFVRSHTGLKMNFNGSGGIWRRAAIEDAGGWQTDTLTEDLDLSYRAQMRGWRGLYLADEVCPCELPTSLLAFKRQQARWARGSAQCTRKLAVPILRSRMPLLHKLGGLMHVSGYFVNVFVLLLVLTTPWLMLGSNGLYALPQWLSLISVIGISPMLAMFVGQCVQGRTRQFIRSVPLAVVLGIGISLSNTLAVIAGLFGKGSGEFVRTPKPAARQSLKPSHDSRQAAVPHAYRLRLDWTLQAELMLGVYTAGIGVVLALHGIWLPVAPVLAYAGCFIGAAIGQVVPE
jgi:cellulose synthase/poly-beta-1,6-N-acetylglucosamine synthase-like glycosyltransferase